MCGFLGAHGDPDNDAQRALCDVIDTFNTAPDNDEVT